MGETGAGISSEDEIAAGTSFSTKWGKILLFNVVGLSDAACSEMIKEVSPWFFRMRSLIGERPNLIPVGIGNTSTPVDDLALLATNGASDFNSDDYDESDEEKPEKHSELAGDDTAPGSNGDSIKITPPPSELPKRKRADSVEVIPTVSTKSNPKKKKKGPLPNTSAPALAKSAPNKAKTTKEKFAEAAKEEEETERRQLDLKKEKVKRVADVKIAKIRAQADINNTKTKGKLELMRLKMQQDHEYRMANVASHQPSFFADTMNNNAFAGSSTYAEFSASGSGSSTPLFDSDLTGPVYDFDG